MRLRRGTVRVVLTLLVCGVFFEAFLQFFSPEIEEPADGGRRKRRITNAEVPNDWRYKRNEELKIRTRYEEDAWGENGLYNRMERRNAHKKEVIKKVGDRRKNLLDKYNENDNADDSVFDRQGDHVFKFQPVDTRQSYREKKGRYPGDLVWDGGVGGGNYPEGKPPKMRPRLKVGVGEREGGLPEIDNWNNWQPGKDFIKGPESIKAPLEAVDNDSFKYDDLNPPGANLGGVKEKGDTFSDLLNKDVKKTRIDKYNNLKANRYDGMQNDRFDRNRNVNEMKPKLMGFVPRDLEIKNEGGFELTNKKMNALRAKLKTNLKGFKNNRQVPSKFNQERLMENTAVDLGEANIDLGQDPAVRNKEPKNYKVFDSLVQDNSREEKLVMQQALGNMGPGNNDIKVAPRGHHGNQENTNIQSELNRNKHQNQGNINLDEAVKNDFGNKRRVNEGTGNNDGNFRPAVVNPNPDQKTALNAGGYKGLNKDNSNDVDLTRYLMSFQRKYKRKLKEMNCTRFKTDSPLDRTADVHLGAVSMRTAPSSWDVTLLTHLSPERLGGLVRLLRGWAGPLTAVVYLESALSHGVLKQIRSHPEIRIRNNVDIHLVNSRGDIYPTNFLKNVGLRSVRTEYTLMVDVDLAPPGGMYTKIKRRLEAGRPSQKEVLVVPAFEMSSNSTALPITKKELQYRWRKGKASPLHFESFPPSQLSTRYDLWVDTTDMYSIEYYDSYTPVYVARTKEIPKFKENIVGTLRNKVSHTQLLYQQGFQFTVLPDVYVVHLSHSDAEYGSQFKRCASAVRKLFRESTIGKMTKRIAKSKLDELLPKGRTNNSLNKKRNNDL